MEIDHFKWSVMGMGKTNMLFLFSLHDWLSGVDSRILKIVMIYLLILFLSLFCNFHATMYVWFIAIQTNFEFLSPYIYILSEPLKRVRIIYSNVHSNVREGESIAERTTVLYYQYTVAGFFLYHPKIKRPFCLLHP